jgi:hypothetical protein
VAVLSSPLSPPALALLEMRDALIEALAHHFELYDRPQPAHLLDEIKRRGLLSAELEARANAMLAGMRAVETAMVAGTPARVTRDEVTQAASVVGDLLDTVGVEVPWPPGFDEGKARGAQVTGPTTGALPGHPS